MRGRRGDRDVAVSRAPLTTQRRPLLLPAASCRRVCLSLRAHGPPVCHRENGAGARLLSPRGSRGGRRGRRGRRRVPTEYIERTRDLRRSSARPRGPPPVGVVLGEKDNVVTSLSPLAEGGDPGPCE